MKLSSMKLIGLLRSIPLRLRPTVILTVGLGLIVAISVYFDATLMIAPDLRLASDSFLNFISKTQLKSSNFFENLHSDERDAEVSPSDSSLEAVDEVAQADEDDSNSLVADIPEYLRVDLQGDDAAFSIINQLGLADTLLPSRNLGKTLTLDRESILNDSENRISTPFKVPEKLRSRVGFWFDIYTKYDSNRRIVHHSRFPWIVFKIVDVSMIVNSDTPRHLWLRRERADRFVKKEELKVLAALKGLASKKDSDTLTEDEQEVAAALSPLGGNIHKQASRARRAVRIQTGQKNFFAEGLRLSAQYFGVMENIFSLHGLPFELTRIPLVESSFNKHATSKVGASGIWQFMNGTGRKYMLVDGGIDERRSPYKATEAAAHLLSENHLILRRDWALAVTAWNHGPTGLRKAIKKTGSRDLADIIANYHSRSFDFASSNFYSEFLGALYAERYSDDIFGELQRHEPDNLRAVKLSRSVKFKVLLRITKIDMDEFLEINPDLVTAAKKNVLIPRGFRLHIPVWALENLSNLFASYNEGAHGDT